MASFPTLRSASALLVALAATLSATASAQAAVTPPPPQIAQLQLMNADSDQPIPEFTPFASGSVLNYTQLPTRALNVQAVTTPAVTGSVVFELDGNPVVENTAPYALVGDVKGDFLSWTPGPGPHTLTVTPYPRSAARGTPGTPVTVTFNVIAQTNALLAPWPGSWASAPAAPQRRVEQASTLIGSKLYVFGGFVNTSYQVTRTYSVYDMVTGTWTPLGTLPEGMAETHLGIADDDRYIYLAGGFGGDLKTDQQPKQWISDRVYRFDPEANTWEQITSLPEPRGGGGLAYLRGQLHYVGGNLTDRFTNSGAHFVYDLATSKWSTAAPLPDPKDHFSTVAYSGKIYVIGGEHGHDVQYKQQVTSHAFDPDTGTWKRLADLPLAKSHAEGSTYASSGKIVYAGGKLANRGPTAEVASYDISTNRWFILTDLPAPRQGGIVQRYQKTIFSSLGGIDASQPQSTTWIGTLP